MSAEEAFITPAVLRWAREQAGYSIEEVANRVGVKPARVEAWETGTAKLTLGRLEMLAAIYKRPTAIFYLPAPPRETFSKPADFRDRHPGRMAPNLIYQIRHAEERREIALELMPEIGELQPVKFSFACRRMDEPEHAGERLRHFLEVAWETQKGWGRSDSSGYAALNGWKEATETAAVLVFQASKNQMGHARGFSLHADVLPVVVLSSEDVPVARCFTLLHELAHLGLHEGGICDLHDRGIERFCNEVAAAALMPKSELHAEMGALRSSKTASWTDGDIRRLAKAFSVSEQALVLRLCSVGAVSWEFYEHKRGEFEARNKQAKERKEPGFVPPHQMALAHNGTSFTRLVLEAYHQRCVTAHRASSYLGLSLEHFGKAEMEVSRRWRRAS